MMIYTTKTITSDWQALKEAVQNGMIQKMLHSGDRIPVTLKDDTEVEFDVTFDEYGKLFFVLHDCLEEHRMNPDWTNKGGWPATEMREYLNTEVFNLLPDDLKEVIADTTIVQVLGGERVECVDKLFLLSKTQVFGEGEWSRNEPEDGHFDIFHTERSRVKECEDNGTWPWFLRSPTSGYSSLFTGVNSNGYADYNGASTSYGVAFGFCI